MKVNKLGAGIVCSLTLAGAVGICAGTLGSSCISKQASATVEDVIRLYFDCNWGGIEYVKVTDSNIAMLKTEDYGQFDTSYGALAYDVTETDAENEIKMYFKQDGAYFHPTKSSDNYSNVSRLEYEFVKGNAYKITNIGYSHESGSDKWFTYDVVDLGAITTIDYKLVFEINDFDVDNYVVDTENLYFKANDNWISSNAWIAAYFYGKSDGTVQWVKAEPAVEGDSHLYKVPRQADQTSIIWCRMSSDSDVLDWGNKWNQTGDLSISNSINYYKITNDGWDNPNIDTSDVWEVNNKIAAEFALYTYLGSDQELGEWPGVDLPKVEEKFSVASTGNSMYAFSGKVGPQHKAIISVKNGTSSTKPQTDSIDIPTTGSGLKGFTINFGETVEVVENPVIAEAYAFLEKFDELTSARVSGNVCNAGADLIESTISAYSELTADARILVDAKADSGDINYTIAQTMAWLIGKYGPKSDARRSIEKTQNEIAIIGSIAALTAVGLLYALLVTRKKRMGACK